MPGWNSKQFTWERLDADRIRLIGEIEIEGDPAGANAGQKFFADELELNTKTGDLTARGNVVFKTPTTQISADSVTFNTKTRLGTFANALRHRRSSASAASAIAACSARWSRKSISRARPSRRSAPTNTASRNGAFTTCVQPTPRWEIVSGNATINLTTTR